MVLGILDRSDQTSTISSISDDVNGSWTLNYVDGGPVNLGAGNRVWLAYRNNCAAGTTTATVTFNAAISSQLAVAYIVSDAGAMTFDAAATARVSGTGETNVDSNTVATSGAGAIVGFVTMNNAQADPEPTADGAGESRLTSGQAGARAFLFFEAYGSSGTYGLETTVDSATTTFCVGAFLEPSGAVTNGPALVQVRSNIRFN
jgi:hypothetical protein